MTSYADFYANIVLHNLENGSVERDSFEEEYKNNVEYPQRDLVRETLETLRGN